MTLEGLFGPAWWLVLTVIGTTLLNVLILAAKWLHEEMRLHDLRVETHGIRRRLKEAAAMRRMFEIDRRSFSFAPAAPPEVVPAIIVDAEPVASAA